MCGIAGYWRQPGAPTAGARAAMEGALERMRLRGPDDRGFEVYQAGWGELAFGHTRLSVIDLSAGGHQPMTSGDGRYTLVFNGEIYNYRELRQELAGHGARFRSQSDSEVLLVAWERWGAAVLPRLVGMFAFALLDREQRTLSCARDAFGMKPMFLASDAHGFSFASELAAAVTLRGAGAQLNLQRCYDYLVHGDYDSSPETFVAGIEHLPPGTLRVLDLATGRLSDASPWWTPQIAPTRAIPRAEAAAQLREMFLDNLRLHLRSDVPLGAALSGGIDSSAVVCAMREVQPDLPLHTFSFVAPGSPVSEEAWVDRINRHVGAVEHKVTVTPAEFANDLDDMIVAQGEPFGSTSIYAQYRVYKLAREHGVTVSLDGQGADEVLAGYHGYPGARLHSLLEQGRVLEAGNFLRHWSGWPGRGVAGALKAVIAEFAPHGLHQGLRALAGRSSSPSWLDAGKLREMGVRTVLPTVESRSSPRGRRLMAALAAAATRHGLPALLRHGDRNSMRFSVESRMPFLTTGLADFMFSLPEDHLVSDRGETKSLFREAMRGIVPDEVLNRRDKTGFATPERDWLVAVAPRARDWIGQDLGLDFLNQAEVWRRFDRMMKGHLAFSWQAWRWINFCRWYVRVFDGLRGAHP